MVFSDPLVYSGQFWVEAMRNAVRLDVTCRPQEGERVCVDGNGMRILRIVDTGLHVWIEQVLYIFEVHQYAAKGCCFRDDGLSSRNASAPAVVNFELETFLRCEGGILQKYFATCVGVGAIVKGTRVLPLQGLQWNRIPPLNLFAPAVSGRITRGFSRRKAEELEEAAPR